MTFTLPSIEDITIDIPDTKGGTITLTVPPLDCMKPADVDKINKQLAEIDETTPEHRNPNTNALALARHLLAFYNPKAKAAIEALVPRQISAIDDYWGKESEISLGESKPSTESSSNEEK